MNLGRLQHLHWPRLQSQLDQKGHTLLPGLVDERTCDQWITGYEDQGTYRKTVVMERHRFGRGEYRYFDYPLPNTIHQLRTALYPYLAPIANRWMRFLNIDQPYPEEYEVFLKYCQEQGQTKATPLILKYGKRGFNTLHQDLYGPVYFPLQVVVFLSEYGRDYQGGAFVMTEQVPRSQSKAMVVQPCKGDALIFSTNFRPVKGQRGYYSAKLKHGVSEVTAGHRYTLGLIFHDALQ